MAAAIEFPNGPAQRQYRAAAKNLRLPYWDWAKPAAAGQTILPSILTQPFVTFDTPSGRTIINNPLYQFQFNGASGPNFGDLSRDVCRMAPTIGN
jgi:tyrosinase